MHTAPTRGKSHWIANALEEEKQVEAGDPTVTRAECCAEAARDTGYTIRAQQERGVYEAQERRADETPAGKCEVAEGEHEACVRVADPHPLVDKIVHREGSDAHLRASAERHLRDQQLTQTGKRVRTHSRSARQSRGCSGIACRRVPRPQLPLRPEQQ